jgi:hypothetical protein
MRVMHRTGFRINSVSTASQLVSSDVKEAKSMQPASQKKETNKKTGSRRRQRKNT